MAKKTARVRRTRKAKGAATAAKETQMPTEETVAVPKWVEDGAPGLALLYMKSETDPITLLYDDWRRNLYEEMGRVGVALDWLRNSPNCLVRDRNEKCDAAVRKLEAVVAAVPDFIARVRTAQAWRKKSTDAADPVLTAHFYRELVSILRDYDDVVLTFGPSTFKLVATTRYDVILRDESGNGEGEFNFGRWIFDIGCNDDTRSPMDRRMRLVAKPVKAVPRGGNYHPHVGSNGNVCFGEGQAAVFESFRAGRFFSLFEVLGSILRTYAPDNPYTRLREWTRQSPLDNWACRNCAAKGTRETERWFCDVCDEPLCANCEVWCLGCEKTLCATHNTLQDVNGKMLCADCRAQR